MPLPRPRLNDTAFDRLIRSYGIAHRGALAEKIGKPRTLLGLLVRGDFGSKELRESIRGALSRGGRKCSVRELNDAIRRSGAEYLETIGEAD
ncbi:MAG TPA: hypothetical protein VEI02_13210 [Planctomycetota bacterium]|nr:hypothetical protein [Planctomycetota bacterium]